MWVGKRTYKTNKTDSNRDWLVHREKHTEKERKRERETEKEIEMVKRGKNNG